MINAYKNGRDLYATIGTGVYNNDYWDNMEHHEDGSPNPDGKKRRKKMKVVMLGVSYGMGAASLAVGLGCDAKEAQSILDNFYKGFPKVKQWKDKVEQDARKNGYVEDVWGRRRRLPDLFLPKYEIKLKNESKYKDFNPLLGSLGLCQAQKNPLIEKYENKLKEARGYKDAEKIKTDASKEGVLIIDHGAHISTAERQCVNAIIQGSAATMSKKAMILVHNDEKLNRLGFKLLIAVHDELIGECPKENAEEVAQRLTELMISSPGGAITTPFKCDAVIEPRWYFSEVAAVVQQKFSDLKDNMTEEEAIIQLNCLFPEYSAFLSDLLSFEEST